MHKQPGFSLYSIILSIRERVGDENGEVCRVGDENGEVCSTRAEGLPFTALFKFTNSH